MPRIKLPLDGQCFYLDVNNRYKYNNLERHITSLGGSVERFLSKDVTCLVTDRPTDMRRTSPRLDNAVTPPFMSRAHAILQKVTPLPVSCSDVVRNAQIWNIAIKPYDEFDGLVTGNTAEVRKPTTRIRKLRESYLKVEDRSRKYRPLLKEMKSWPRPNLDASPGNSPFDDVKPRPKRPPVPKRRSPRKRRLSQSSPAKTGYCEVCCTTYHGIAKHLNSQGHKAKSRSVGKYCHIDELIHGGDSIQSFIHKVAKRRKTTASGRHKDQTTPQTVTIRRSTRLLSDSKNREGSAYFTLSTT